jgi:hypothetical protein
MSAIGVLAEESSTPTRVLLNLLACASLAYSTFLLSARAHPGNPPRWSLDGSGPSLLPLAARQGTIREATNGTQY